MEAGTELPGRTSIHCNQFFVCGTMVEQVTSTSRAQQSSGVAEYIGISKGMIEALRWINTLIYCFPVEMHPIFPVPFYCDSTAANAMAKSYSMTKSVKHLDIATNQCRDFVAAHIFDVRHIQEPSADMSTKVSKSRPDHIRKCGAFIDCNSSQSDSWKTWTDYIKQNSHQLKKYST